MPQLSAIAGILSSLVGVAVGFRLMRLALRTRQAPEAAMATAFLTIYVLGFPAVGVSRVPSFVGTAPGNALFAAGISSIGVGLHCFSVFSWRTFRPTARWAAGLATAAALIMAAAVIHLALAVFATTELGAPAVHAAARRLLAAAAIPFAWCGVESLLTWRAAQRRLSLGLGDAAVVNRLALFATASLTGLAILAVVAVILGGGRAVLQVPLFQLGMTVANLVIGTCWGLAFLPPAAYVAHVRARSERARSH